MLARPTSSLSANMFQQKLDRKMLVVSLFYLKHQKKKQISSKLFSDFNIGLPFVREK
jgi:hypothetical protein